MQATTTREAVVGAGAAAAMLLLVEMGVTVVAAMVTTPMEEVETEATTVAMAALPEATMAMVAMEAMLLVVSVLTIMTSDSNQLSWHTKSCSPIKFAIPMHCSWAASALCFMSCNKNLPKACFSALSSGTAGDNNRG